MRNGLSRRSLDRLAGGCQALRRTSLHEVHRAFGGRVQPGVVLGFVQQDDHTLLFAWAVIVAHARQALEHFRQSTKEQRDQDQRKHEQQVQYLQAELRTVNEALATKQQQAVQTLQENARLLGDLSRAQGDLHQIQEEVRSLRPLKDELGFAQRRTEELGRRLVEQEAAIHQLNASNDQLQARLNDLTTAKQQLELALVAAKSSVTAQEQVVASLLERFSATVPSPDAAAKDPLKGSKNR